MLTQNLKVVQINFIIQLHFIQKRSGRTIFSSNKTGKPAHTARFSLAEALSLSDLQTVLVPRVRT